MTDSIVSFIQKVFGLLPQDPFRAYIDGFATDIRSQHWIGVLNYFVPLKEMLGIASAWLVAVGTYVVVRTFIKNLTN